jgi:hypothetical protein
MAELWLFGVLVEVRDCLFQWLESWEGFRLGVAGQGAQQAGMPDLFSTLS